MYDGKRVVARFVGACGAALLAVVVSSHFGATLIARQPPMAFEGFGTVTRGHLDCPGGNWITYHVTNLNDSGPGSLRNGLSAGCRLIVFDVAGTIPVNSDLSINQDYVTIDGATAPAPGITLETATNQEWIAIIGNNGSGADGVHDVIVRHLRAVGPGGHGETSSDLFGIDGQSFPAYNIILDHLTLVASNDGAIDIWGTVHDVTISWNFIKDTQTATVFSSDHLRRNISVHHNVFTGNNERQIKTNQRNEMIDYVNNVVYGWGWMVPTGTGLDLDAEGYTSTHPQINVINSYFKFVPGLNGGENRAIVTHGTGRLFFQGNIVPPGESNTVSTSSYHAIPSYAQVTTYSASSLGTTVVPCVGTMFRTAAEQSTLDTISRAIGGPGGTCPGGGPVTTPPQPPTNVRIVR